MMTRSEPRLKLGYCPTGAPGNGIGPFGRIFHTGVNLGKEDSLKNVDAVVLWGGEDISSSLYDETPEVPSQTPSAPSRRDLFEWQVLTEARDKKIPVIGVCRGAQLACVFAGGKLIQDVNNHHGDHVCKTYDSNYISMNSCHHQMMWPYDIKHELLAWTSVHKAVKYKPESLEAGQLEQRQVPEPEVVWFPEISALAIQGHPEWLDEFDLMNNWIMKEIRFRQGPLMV